MTLDEKLSNPWFPWLQNLDNNKIYSTEKLWEIELFYINQLAQCLNITCTQYYPVAQTVESACNAGDLSSIPKREDPLENEMATHSSILAWKIPWLEEPGRLQSMGLQRVGTTE